MHSWWQSSLENRLHKSILLIFNRRSGFCHFQSGFQKMTPTPRSKNAPNGLTPPPQKPLARPTARGCRLRQREGNGAYVGSRSGSCGFALIAAVNVGLFFECWFDFCSMLALTGMVRVDLNCTLYEGSLWREVKYSNKSLIIRCLTHTLNCVQGDTDA